MTWMAVRARGRVPIITTDHFQQRDTVGNVEVEYQQRRATHRLLHQRHDCSGLVTGLTPWNAWSWHLEQRAPWVQYSMAPGTDYTTARRPWWRRLFHRR